MKNLKKLIFAILIFLVFNNLNIAQQLIAHYPLSANANDSTGNYAAMTLINTPFQDGGIYCNGIYSGSGNPDYCHATTPQLTNLDLSAFYISADFKVIEALTSLHPVFACGFSYRWLVFYLAPDSTVLLKYNNNNYQSSTLRYNINQWHRAAISYRDSVADLYLDDSLAVSINVLLIHGNDKDIGITDFGSGNTFKGIFKDLKIYNLDTSVTDLGLHPNNIPIVADLYQNYPNPFNPVTTIQYSVPQRSNVTLKVYDVLGKEVASLVNEEKERGVYSVNFSAIGGSASGGNASQLASGIYFYRLQAGSFVETKKMIFLK